MQAVVLEKLVLIQRTIIHIHNFEQFCDLVFEETMKKDDVDIESYCTKSNFLIGILTEEILTVALRETDFE